MKNNVFKKTLIILIFILIPAIAALGFASWYVVNEYRIKPKYNPNSAFYIYLNNQVTTYSGSTQLPTSPYITFDETVSYSYRLVGETNSTEGAPVDAGEYYILFESDKDTEGFESTEVYYKINPADVTLESISVNYDEISGENFFTTNKDTSTISYNAVFKFNNKPVEGVTKYSDAKSSLSIGTFEYEYKFEPTSNNFNVYEGEKVSISTYATVSFLDDDGSLITNDYVELNGVVTKPDNSSITPNIYVSEKTAFENWYLGETLYDFSTKVTSNISLISSWTYKQYTLTLINVDKNSTNDGFIYSSNNTYTETFTVKSLNMTIKVPTSDIKYFYRWTGTETIDGDITISTAGDKTYTANWWDIITINNKTYDHADYTSTRLTYSTVAKDLVATSNIEVKDPNGISYTTAVSYLTVKAMHNGYYYHGDLTAIPTEYRSDVVTNTSSNLTGSTYLAYISIGSMAPFIIIDNYTGEYVYPGSNTSVIVSYKTAIYNGTNLTIEEAIYSSQTSGGTITLNGNSSAYVETCFSNISFYNILSEAYNDFSDGTIHYSITNTYLLAPYNSENTHMGAGTGSSDKVYSALTIPSNITLNLKSSSYLIACAEINHTSTVYASKTFIRGVIMNQGVINAENQSFIYAYGFIKGTGLINMQPGSTAKDVMTTYDWPGGTAAVAIVSSVLPINSWSMHNISCMTKINHGSTYKIHLYADMGATINSESYIVTSNSSVGALFLSKSGYILKYALPAIKENNTLLYTISGNNQVAGQRDILEICGEYQDLKFTLETGMTGVTLTTDTSKPCPLSFTSIILRKGSAVSLSKNDYLFFPGTTLTVESGASLSIGSSVDLSFQSLQNINDSQISGGNRNFTKYCVDDDQDAIMYVDGSITVSGGNIGGLIKPLSANSQITFSGSLKTTFKSLYSTSDGRYYTVTNYYARGNINGTERAFASGTYTSTLSGNEYIWSGSSSGTTSSLHGTLKPASSTCVTEDTLITLANGNQVRIDQLTGKEMILVLNHSTGRLESRPLAFLVSHDKVPKSQLVTELFFSNGASIKVIGDHGFFNATTNKYININSDVATNYIGDKFLFNNNGIFTEETLVDVKVYEDTVRTFSIASYENITCFTNGILSSTPYFDPYLNAFDINEDTYMYENMEEDIEKYGLFTYEDVKDYMTYEEFTTYNLKYVKISIGKGYITWEEFLETIEIFRSIEDDIV